MTIVTRWKNICMNYINNNIKEYALVTLLFVIGLFIGVMIVNNCSENLLQEVSAYLSDFVNKLENIDTINKSALIIDSIKSNIILSLVLWISGTAIIGLPIVLIVILYRGLCLGYTISVITYTFGTIKGIGFCISSIFFQNILFIPAVLTLGVSSMKLYKSIVKDRGKENIKIEIIRHTIIFCFMIVVLMISSIIENLISVSILHRIINYF